MSNPLPVSLPQECRKASKLLSAFADPTKGLDSIIPAHVLRKAKGFAFLTVVKAGFVFSARAGTGLVIARLPDGSWSAPSAVGTMGAGAGFQVGVEMAEFIIILNSRAAVKSFMAAGSLSIGGNMSIATGPIGRNFEGSASVSTKGKVAAMYSYSRTKGLFGGASIEGSVIVERSDANRQAYGYNVSSKQLLSGSVDRPRFAEILIDTIERRSGGQKEWNPDVDEDEEDMRNSFGNDPKNYSFGSAYASGSSGASPTSSGMEKSNSFKGGIGGKLAGYVPGNRSRSNSSAAAAAARASLEPASSTTLPQNERTREGPISSGTSRFETQFNADSTDDDDEPTRWRGSVNNKKSAPNKLSRPNSYSRSPELERRSEYQFEGQASSSGARDSFDSLDDQNTAGNRIHNDGYYQQDDDDLSYSKYNNNNGRFRSSTLGNEKRPIGLLARARSASNPWSSKAKKAAAARGSSDFINENPSPFDDEVAAVDTRSRSSSKSRGNKTSTAPIPWDSEEESFYTEERASTRLRSSSRGKETSTNVIHTPRGERKDPFDFSEVEADFTSNINSFHPGTHIKSNPSSGTSTPRGNRSRSGTINGIGKAIALFDFPGVEATDLPFKKGDVITILSKDDEMWWKGRLKMNEGMIPATYLEAHFD